MGEEHAAIPLDPRLLCAASLVPTCRVVADIGCDHGRLSAWLLQTGRCERAIASDVSPTARARARSTFQRLGLIDKVALSDRDGLAALTEPVGAVVICGIGGKTLSRILAQDVELHGATLICSPQTDLPLARDAVYRRGYHISAEYAVSSRGRFYLVWIALTGAGEMTVAQRFTGVNLTGFTPGAARNYLLWQTRVAASWQGADGETYRNHLKEALSHADADGTGHP